MLVLIHILGLIGDLFKRYLFQQCASIIIGDVNTL